MNRLPRLILVIALLISCYGCFIPGHGWVVPGDELPGVHDGGGNSDHDSGHGKKH